MKNSQFDKFTIRKIHNLKNLHFEKFIFLKVHTFFLNIELGLCSCMYYIVSELFDFFAEMRRSVCDTKGTMDWDKPHGHRGAHWFPSLHRHHSHLLLLLKVQEAREKTPTSQDHWGSSPRIHPRFFTARIHSRYPWAWCSFCVRLRWSSPLWLARVHSAFHRRGFLSKFTQQLNNYFRHSHFLTFHQ